MTDWADDEAEKVGLTLHWEHKSDCVKIAAALRKAKADGMRLVARQVISGGEAAGLLRLADKIERGEA